MGILSEPFFPYFSQAPSSQYYPLTSQTKAICVKSICDPGWLFGKDPFYIRNDLQKSSLD